MSFAHRRDFLKQSAAMLALGNEASAGGQGRATPRPPAGEAFSAFQAKRRKELWSLLGDLPWDHKPGQVSVVKTEKHDGYTLQRLVLDLNGIEPVPALLLIPDKRQNPAPGLLSSTGTVECTTSAKNNFWSGQMRSPPMPLCARKRAS